MPLVLFDIDGTLILSGGVGRASMAAAGRRLFGHDALFSGVAFAGSIDPQIVARGMASRGIPPTPRRIGRLRATYLRELRRRIGGATGGVLPGVREAVRATAEHAAIGLLTGNWREGARIKLARFGLWDEFEPVIGAFGGDAHTRDELVPIAVRRALRRGVDVREVLVVGDTPADVRCARAGQAALRPLGCRVRCLGVLTGWSDEAALRAAGADAIVPDLREGLPRLLSLVRGVG